MPLQTFFNIDEDKRNMLEAVLLNTFYKEHICQIKVATIVKEANISRAAFYKYFSDLEDAHTYMINKVSGIIHKDILFYINENRNDFFLGIRRYLDYCCNLDRSDPYWMGIEILIKGEATILYKRLPLDNTSPMIMEWSKILELNQFEMRDFKEILSFLYFMMDMVINSLTSFIVNGWTKEDFFNDFSYKSDWVLKGIK